MSRVFSYISFPASDKFKNERQSHISILHGLITTGMVSSYHGLQTPEEGGKMGYLVSVWNSVEALDNFLRTNRAKFEEILSAISTGNVQRYRFVAVGPRLPTGVINSKISEFLIIKPKGSADAAKAAALRLSDIVDSKGVPSAVGESIDGGVFILGAGAESLADFDRAAKDEAVRPALGALGEAANTEVTRANLIKET